MAYTPTNWQTGDTITAEKLNHAEQGIKNNDTAISESAPVVVFTAGNAVDISSGYPLVRFTAEDSASIDEALEDNKIVILKFQTITVGEKEASEFSSIVAGYGTNANGKKILELANTVNVNSDSSQGLYTGYYNAVEGILFDSVTDSYYIQLIPE